MSKPFYNVLEIAGKLKIEKAIICSKCDFPICKPTENYKEHSLINELPITEVNPYQTEPSLLVDDEIVLRQFYCPECGTLLHNEVRRKDEPLLWDVKIATY